jgi:very-short-patch-repair endonuclease
MTKMTKEKTPAHMIELARHLRQNQTNAETLIWQLIRNRQVANAKFRRQQPIEGYIADFYCHEHKLVIELDGSQHFTEDGIKQDALRTQRLHQLGITVLRFDNRQVFLQTEAVLQMIYEQLRVPHPIERPHPSPLPEGEGTKSLALSLRERGD